jgi:phosphate transport system substrate-binding protein
MHRRLVTALCVLALLGLEGCSRDTGQKGKLTGSGSTFIEPMMQKWAEVYKEEKGVEVNYQGIGSGAGIKQMMSQAVDFGCTDAYMSEEDLAAAEKQGGPVVHIPLLMGGIVPAYNLKGIDKSVRFTGEVLADIFLGKIKKWNDPKLQELQEPGVQLPDQDIATVHRADASGSTAIFTDFLSQSSSEWKARVGSKTTVKWPVGGGEPGNPGVAKFIQDNPGSIGYVELIYALQQNLPYGSVKNQAGHYVLASLESVKKAAEGALKNIPDDLRYTITNAPGAEAYPISGTTWAVLYVKQPAATGTKLVDFLRWVTHDGQKYTEGLKYAALPSGLVERIDQKLKLIKVGAEK